MVRDECLNAKDKKGGDFSNLSDYVPKVRRLVGGARA
jgi:hypothetical protein